MMLLVVVVAVAFLVTNRLSALDPNRYLGFTEEQVLHHLGRPDRERSGQFGAEPGLAQKCRAPQTMTYERPTGILLVTVCECGGKRTVVRAKWLSTFMMF